MEINYLPSKHMKKLILYHGKEIANRHCKGILFSKLEEFKTKTLLFALGICLLVTSALKLFMK